MTALADVWDAPPILARLRGVQRAGAGWLAYCPAHEDREHRSLSVGVGDNGRTLVHCHARGCTVEQIAGAVRMTVAELAPADDRQVDRPHPGRVTRYEIRDPAGELVAVHVREDRASGKRMWWERPDGARGLGGRPVVDLPLYRIDRLGESSGAVVVTEGESAADALACRGIAAVGTVTGASATPGDVALRPLLARRPVILWADHDEAGRGHMRRIRDRLRALGQDDVRTVTWPDAHGGDDAVDYYARGGTVEACRAMIAAASPASEERSGPETGAGRRSPWDAAHTVAELLAGEDDEVHYLDPLHSLVRGALTQWYSPRGVGKTHVLHALLVALARNGRRVLLLDRDNPRREIKRRLRAWGAGDVDPAALHVLTRDEAPPLTDRAAWALYPIQSYDVLAVDSLDASTEGVGEQDSAAPSRAIAALLDVAHRADGPAVIVLGNTTKSGGAGRGSGVVEDRADIVYEIRDATDYRPTGERPWWEELPPAARTDWAGRATRRKRRDAYRLAIIATKHRVGPEPEPRVVETDLSTEPWSWRDVTAELEGAGEQAREAAAGRDRDRLDAAAAALAAEIDCRETSGAAPLAKHEAEAVLVGAGLRRQAARDLLTARAGVAWALKPDAGDARRVRVARASPASAAASPTPADPHGQRGFWASDAADRMNTGRPDFARENAPFSGANSAADPLADSRAGAPEGTEVVL